MRHPCLGFALIAIILTSFVLYVVLVHLELSVIAAYLISINLVTFLLYWYDMQISPAKDKRTRIPEWLLLGLVFVGGTVGGILSMLFFRHKVVFKRKWWFQLRLLCIVIVQFTAIYCSPYGQPETCRDVVGSVRALHP